MHTCNTRQSIHEDAGATLNWEEEVTLHAACRLDCKHCLLAGRTPSGSGAHCPRAAWSHQHLNCALPGIPTGSTSLLASSQGSTTSRPSWQHRSLWHSWGTSPNSAPLWLHTAQCRLGYFHLTHHHHDGTSHCYSITSLPLHWPWCGPVREVLQT